MNKTSVKNGKIELLRLFFCVSILLFHNKYLLPDHKLACFVRGSLSVEFFFLVSGYLMARSAARASLSSAPAGSTGSLTKQFLSRKITSLMPNYYIAWGIGFVVTMAGEHNHTIAGWIRRFCGTIWELLFLNMAGFGEKYGDINLVCWYISSMLIAMLILYPLCLKYFSAFVHIIAPATALLVLGFFAYTTHTPLNPGKYIGIMYKGTLRAFGELCLGAACYPLISGLQGLSLSKFGRWLVSISELSAWLLVCLIIILSNKGSYDFLIILLMAAGLILTFSQQGIFSDLWNNKICYTAGAFSLSLFLCHVFWAINLNSIFPGNTFGTLFVLYLLLSFFTALFVHLVSGLLRRRSAAIFGKLKGLLLQ